MMGPTLAFRRCNRQVVLKVVEARTWRLRLHSVIKDSCIDPIYLYFPDQKHFSGCIYALIIIEIRGCVPVGIVIGVDDLMIL